MSSMVNFWGAGVGSKYRGGANVPHLSIDVYATVPLPCKISDRLEYCKQPGP